MTKVSYKCFNADGQLIKIVNTLDEARKAANEMDGYYEIYYTYRETYSQGHAWALKRLSGKRT